MLERILRPRRSSPKSHNFFTNFASAGAGIHTLRSLKTRASRSPSRFESWPPRGESAGPQDRQLFIEETMGAGRGSRRLPKSFLRTGHGMGAGVPRIEVPSDELSKPIPAPLAPPAVPLQFREDGKIADAATAAELGRRGGLAKARRIRLIDTLGLAKIAEDSAFGPYRASAEEFVAYHLVQLAAVAGGVVGPAPSTMVASAALQLAASRYCFDQFALMPDRDWAKTGSTLANDSKTMLLAAYELAVREAAARAATPTDPLAAWRTHDDGGEGGPPGAPASPLAR